MKTDTHKTKVKFLIEKDWTNPEGKIITGDVMAVFTEEVRIGADKQKLFTSYAHIGQHTEACEEYINECKPATEEQYKGLKNELEGLGYNLEVVTNQLTIN